jgi:hypothetical protein
VCTVYPTSRSGRHRPGADQWHVTVPGSIRSSQFVPECEHLPSANTRLNCRDGYSGEPRVCRGIEHAHDPHSIRGVSCRVAYHCGSSTLVSIQDRGEDRCG